jgi:hypothetical protein
VVIVATFLGGMGVLARLLKVRRLLKDFAPGGVDLAVVKKRLLHYPLFEARVISMRWGLGVPASLAILGCLKSWDHMDIIGFGLTNVEPFFRNLAVLVKSL